jgi:hypothetical protein
MVHGLLDLMERQDRLACAGKKAILLQVRVELRSTVYTRSQFERADMRSTKMAPFAREFDPASVHRLCRVVINGLKKVEGRASS